MAKVSLIIPVYNTEKFIRRALNSACMQTYKDMEIIVVDDGSTDDSGCICDEYEKNYKNIRVIHSKNCGSSAARNLGLDAVTGEYIMFMDSDDYFDDDAVEKAVMAIEEKKADLVYFFAIKEDEAGKALYNIDFKRESYSFSNDEDRFKYIVGDFVNYRNGWEVCFRVYRAQLLNKYNIRFSKEHKFAEDLEFTLRYVMCCDRIEGIDERIYHYTTNQNSVMSEHLKDMSRSVLTITDIAKSVYEFAIDTKKQYIADNYHFIYYLLYEWQMREFARVNGYEKAKSLSLEFDKNSFHVKCMEQYKEGFRILLDRYGNVSGYTSVIVPVYNIKPYIDKCIESVLRQSCGRLQIILVDDGATDGSGISCDEWAKKDYRIEVIHKKNGGLSDARNAGIAVASGQYTYFLDGDDYIDDNLITVVVGAIEKNQADMCTFRARQIVDGKECDYGNFFEYGKCYFNTDEDRFKFLYDKYLIYKLGWEAWKSLFVTDIIKNNNLTFISEREIFAEDMLFSTCYLLYANNIMCITDILYNYISRQGSLMNEKKDNIMIVEFNKIAYYIQREIKKAGCSVCEDKFYRLYERVIMWHCAYLMWNVGLIPMEQQLQQISESDVCQNNIRLLLSNVEESEQIYGHEELLRNYSLYNYLADKDIDSFKKRWKSYLKTRNINIFKNKVKYHLEKIKG